MIKRPPIMMAVLFTASVLLTSCYGVHKCCWMREQKQNIEKVEGIRTKKQDGITISIGGLIRIESF